MSGFNNACSDVKSTVNDIKRDLLFEIIIRMRRALLSVEDARKITGDFLALLPVESCDELFAKLFRLADKHTEVRSVFVKHAGSYHEENRQNKLFAMRECLTLGDVECALSVAKRG